MAPSKQSGLRKLPALLAAGRLDTAQQLERIGSMERNIGLPVRAGLGLAAAYYLFLSEGIGEATSLPEVVLEFVRGLMIGYLALNVIASAVLLSVRNLGWGWLRWLVFTVSLMDGFFLAAVTLVAGGFDSGLYWFFFGLLVRNAISVPVAALQILLNLSVCIFYGVMSVVDVTFVQPEAENLFQPAPMTEALNSGWRTLATEPFILRLGLLLLMAACCYGIQVLYDRNLRAQKEAREFRGRQEQLHTAGRLAAEIAHQLKNPLAIINNAAFNLQRALGRENASVAEQLSIIREEVERSDRIITQVMDYSQLAEGQVERVDVAEVAGRAVELVFPPPLKLDVRVEKSFAPGLPRLLMQRRHLEDALVNLLKNAREAVSAGGRIGVSIQLGEDERLVIAVEDSGLGVPPELRERIFEPYYTTRPKGSGLGLAIVKHNVELYGGTVRVESGLGNGARFVLEFPTKTILTA